MNETSTNVTTEEIKPKSTLDNAATVRDMLTMSNNCDEMAAMMLFMAEWFRDYSKPLADAVAVILCTYCKAKLPEADLKAHIETCDKHPLAAALAAAAKAEAELAELRDTNSEAHDALLLAAIKRGAVTSKSVLKGVEARAEKAEAALEELVQGVKDRASLIGVRPTAALPLAERVLASTELGTGYVSREVVGRVVEKLKQSRELLGGFSTLRVPSKTFDVAFGALVEALALLERP